MNAKTLSCAVALACAVVAACSPTPPASAPAVTAKVVTQVLQGTPQVVTATPPAPPEPGSAHGGSGLPAVPAAQQRMIVKSGELSLLVADTDVAVGAVRQVSVDYVGYVLSARTWYEDGYKLAQITIAVPSDQYESALARLRGAALRVLSETSSGQDVTDEYVDLDSRLRNLETQADRLRVFMGEAQNVQEAITVSQSLGDVESQIEQIKGRMNYLEGRSAFSTITVSLQPQRPTPTPTSTATPTPTPTPKLWSPSRTASQAAGTVAELLQGLGDALIWLVIVAGPFAVPAAVGVFLWRRRRR